jgi:hypothetical protein
MTNQRKEMGRIPSTTITFCIHKGAQFSSLMKIPQFPSPSKIKVSNLTLVDE